MSVNGDGYNGRFTAQQFIDAMPGTGGIVSKLAERCKCAWHTARGAIERWPTVKRAWQNERHRVSDKAQSNVITAIVENGDLPTSKWWLQLMDDEFMPKQRQEIVALLKNLDMSTLSTEQLERIAQGDDPIHVIAGTARKG